MAAKTLMIQGTGSHVGKSILTAALCRIFVRRGRRVAPFKAQNMSNNSFVTPEGYEIGRAQAVQAAACRIPSHVDFNPVLIKPEGDRLAQLIVEGSIAGRLLATDFGCIRREHHGAVLAAFQRLTTKFDLIMLEGAGSPAEINLRQHDIVNMTMAQAAQAPVLLVGDIDRGGVFASLVGTLTLLEPKERRHVKGFIINKFRGELDLLTPGLEMLRERTGIGCLGVLPHWGNLRIPEEDSLGSDSWIGQKVYEVDDGFDRKKTLRIGVVDLPYLSNFTDFDSLVREADVQLLRISAPTEQRLDALIFPGTKSTVQGLRYVRERGLDRLAHKIIRQGGKVIGLCGGYQILGRSILDPLAIESSDRVLEGVGLLDAMTVFERPKVTVQVFGRHRESGCEIEGYEVHMGRTEVDQAEPLLDLRVASDQPFRAEGAVRADGLVLGTYVHGLFDAAPFRRVFLNGLRAVRGWPPLACSNQGSLDDDLDHLADFVEEYLDLATIETVIEQGI